MRLNYKRLLNPVREGTRDGRKVFTTSDGKYFYTREKAAAHEAKSGGSSVAGGSALTKWVASVDKAVADAGRYEEQDETVEVYAENDQSGGLYTPAKFPTVRQLFSGRTDAKHKRVHDKLLGIFNKNQSVAEAVKAWNEAFYRYWQKVRQDASKYSD